MESRHNRLKEEHSKLSLEDRLEAEFEAEMAMLHKSADDLVADADAALQEETAAPATTERRRRRSSRRALE